MHSFTLIFLNKHGSETCPNINAHTHLFLSFKWILVAYTQHLQTSRTVVVLTHKGSIRKVSHILIYFYCHEVNGLQCNLKMRQSLTFSPVTCSSLLCCGCARLPHRVSCVSLLECSVANSSPMKVASTSAKSRQVTPCAYLQIGDAIVICTAVD